MNFLIFNSKKKNDNFKNLMFNNVNIIDKIESTEKSESEKEDSCSSFDSVNSENVFEYAININDSNDTIISIFKEITKKLNTEDLEIKKNNLLQQIKSIKNVFNYNIVKNDINKLTEEIRFNSTLKNNYYKTIKPHLLKYLRIRDFQKLEEQEKSQIVYDFFKISNSFCKTTYIKPVHQKKHCINCNGSTFINKKHVYMCADCGLEENILINTIDFTEDNKAFGDKDKETFTKALMKFQGKNNEDIPDYIINKIYSYCDNYDIMYKNVKKQDMYNILQQLGFPNYYEDINLILYKFNKTPLPDLSQYEEQLKINYMLGESVYEKIKIDRKSSLNIQYLLFKHLELLGYPCSKDEFKIIETREILIGYDNIWSQMCEHNRWEFKPTI